MGTVRRGAHNVHQIHYHFVTPIKYRRSIFDKPDRERALREIVKEIEERFELSIEELGVDRNHAHWLVSAAPQYSPSHIVRVLKSVTAREMFRRCPDLKQELWGGELWTDGFYVATVGEGASKEVIQRYVARQGKKAQRGLESGQLKLFDL